MKSIGGNKRGREIPNSIELQDVEWAARMAERLALGRLEERARLAGCPEHFRRALAAHFPAWIQDMSVELAVAASRGGFTPGGGY